MSPHYKKIATLGTALCLASGLSFAQPAANEKHAEWATEVRESLFTLLGHNMGPVGGMLKKKVPYNAEVVAQKAANIYQLSLMIADVSKVDTRKFDVDTEALPAIWENPEDYAQKIVDLTEASEKLSKIALSAPEAEVRAAMGAMGKTCGSCHDSYKED